MTTRLVRWGKIFNKYKFFCCLLIIFSYNTLNVFIKQNLLCSCLCFGIDGIFSSGFARLLRLYTFGLRRNINLLSILFAIARYSNNKV